MKTIATLTAAIALSACAANAQTGARPLTVGPYQVSEFDISQYSQEQTECDRLAANPDDPNRVAEGREKAEMDLPAVVTACRAAVAAEPDNPRLNYQLARVLGYSGKGEEAMQYRIRAVNAGYPQSLFVIGYIHMLGQEIAQDKCLGGELMRLSGLRGRIAGQVGFPYYALDGQFDGCDVKMDKVEMLGMLDAAEPRSYYERLLVSSLKARVSAEMD